MPKYVFAYHGGQKPETDEACADGMARWGAWMEKHKAQFADPGNPVGLSTTVSSSGVVNDGGSNPLSGYSVVEVATLDEAIEIAKGCPILDTGSIEIAEVIEM